MPIPLIALGIGTIGGVFGAAASDVGKSYAHRFLKRQLHAHSEEIEGWALSNVFEHLGLPDLMSEGGLNRAAFTDAINNTFLSGQAFQLSNVFDGEAVKMDALRFGLVQIAEEAGLALEDVSIKGMWDAIREWIMDQVLAEITAEDVGELIEDARDVYEIIALYRKYKKAEADGEAEEANGRKPLINTPEAAANRERQRRFREKHRKVWVAR